MAGAVAALEAELGEALTLARASKTLQAAALLAGVEAAAKEMGDLPEASAFRDRLATDEALCKIRAEAARIAHLRETLNSDDQWTVTSVTSSGVRTLFRQDEETHPFHLIRVEGTVEAPLLDLLAIMAEVDLWPQWMIPQTWVCGLRQAEVLNRACPTHLVCRLAATMPWPITHRDLIMEVKAVDCMDAHETFRRQIVILLNSCDTFPGTEIPPEDPYVRVDVKLSGILLTPEIPANGDPITKTQVQLVICADPKVAYLPSWVMNLFMKNLVFLFLPALRRQVPEVSKPGSVYRRRIQDHPELYGFLQQRMRECFPSHPPASACER